MTATIWLGDRCLHAVSSRDEDTDPSGVFSYKGTDLSTGAHPLDRI